MIVLIIVFALHISLLGLLIFGKGGVAPTQAEPGFVQIAMLVAVTPATSKPPPPSMPSKLTALPVPSFSLTLQDEFEINAATAKSGNCSTLNEVSAALLADPVAITAIRQAPPETRCKSIRQWPQQSSTAPTSANRQHVEALPTPMTGPTRS